MRFRSLSTLFGVIFVLIMAGCATQNQRLQALHVTDREFTSAVQQYNAAYDAAPATVQAKWRRSIDPVVLQADEALQMWQLAIDTETDPNNRIQTFLKLKTQLLTLLLSEGIITVKEE